MGSHPTGSNELLRIETDILTVSIKGDAAYMDIAGDSTSKEAMVKISYKRDNSRTDGINVFVLGLQNQKVETPLSGGVYSVGYICKPLFQEQRDYEVYIESEGHTVSFKHVNPNIQNKVMPIDNDKGNILYGHINFQNDIGYSDFDIFVDQEFYMRITIEVFPSKIDYKEDYQAILDDITKEVYNLVFDFLKKTYFSYQLGEKTQNSLVEFLAILHNIFADFLKAADMILAHPHHSLEVTHVVIPGYKIKQTDRKTLQWIEKHPEQVKLENGKIVAERAMAVKKQVTYNTNENRLTKYMLQSVVRTLKDFKKKYSQIDRTDSTVIEEVDKMIKKVNTRCNASFLSEVDTEDPMPSLSLVFAMAPGYRELYRCYLMLQRSLSISGEIFNISLKDLATLYEYWCFLKINNFLRNRFTLESQDIIKIKGNGIFVSLVKGKASHVEYRNPQNGDHIILTYNKSIYTPTVSQKPDNILTIISNDKAVRRDYIFDSKYKIDFAIPGTYYYDNISKIPGPKVDDINTMHRYRDAIVSKDDDSKYNQTVTGAYILFPFQDEEQYQEHPFYKSIDLVNIGGVPFLPGTVNLVSNLLDQLIG